MCINVRFLFLLFRCILFDNGMLFVASFKALLFFIISTSCSDDLSCSNALIAFFNKVSCLFLAVKRLFLIFLFLRFISFMGCPIRFFIPLSKVKSLKNNKNSGYFIYKEINKKRFAPFNKQIYN